MPERIFQSRACSAGSWVKRAGSRRSRPAAVARAVRSRVRRGRIRPAPWNSTSRAAAPSGSALMPGGMPGWFSTERSEARSSSSSAAAPASRRGTMAAQAACRSGKSRKPVTFTGRSGTDLQHRLGDEGQGAFGAHQQVAEDVHRPVEIDEGVQGIARGVLHPVLGADALGQGRVRREFAP